MEFVQEMLGDDNFFDKYFQTYFDVALTKEDALSEENNVVKSLDMIANYILMGSSLKKQPPIKTDGENTDNYYKSNDMRIFDRDFRDEELAPLRDYKLLKDTIKKLRDNGVNGKRNYDRMIGEINKDMLIVKQDIKRPVELSGCYRGFEPINWAEVDYHNLEHLRELIVIGCRPLNSDLGIITRDMENMIKNADLSPTERKVVGYIRLNGASQIEAAEYFGCSRARINQIVASAAHKVLEYNLDHVKYDK